MIIIKATLKEWRLDDENGSVTGVIFNSIDPKEYPEGAQFTIMKVSLHQYGASEMFGEEHYIAETQLGNFFRLNASDMR